jgi:hypothetical protein
VKIQVFVAQWVKIKVFFRQISEDASLRRQAYEDTLLLAQRHCVASQKILSSATPP